MKLAHLPLWLRRASQLASLALWVALFLSARSETQSFLRTDLFLTSDPLIAAMTLGAAQVVVPGLLWAVPMVLLTLVFGRAFCGWLCPLGTIFDAVARVIRPRPMLSLPVHQRLQGLKYLLLAAMVVGSVFSAQWLYLLDPLALLTRGVAAGVYPVFAALLPPKVLPAPMGLSYHAIAFAPAALLAVVIGLTVVAPRFYCRYACPLGAFYGLMSRVALLRRRVSGCDACAPLGQGKTCLINCRMGAVLDNSHYAQSHECIRCFSGQVACPADAIGFKFRWPWLERHDRPLDIGRRRLLLASVGGAAAAPLFALTSYHRQDRNLLVRPPRVTSEERFLDACIRCGLCVQACPTQTLQLTNLEAGVAGLWAPALTPTVGGCIAGCNACSVVCSTDAIPEFSRDEGDKWAEKMGTAVLDKGRCIGFTENSKCGECVRVCPTKAFVVEPAHGGVPLRPVAVDYVRCTGCGLCETKCRQIVFGAPAVTLYSHGRGEPTTLAAQPSASYEAKTVPVSD